MKNRYYIFLTPSITKVGGAELYVSRKVSFLESNGWNVIVFSYRKDAVKISNLKRYDSCIYPDMEIPFGLVSCKTRTKIIDFIINKIGESSKIIIEAHTIDLALYGEQLASISNGTCITYLLSEVFNEPDAYVRSFLEFKMSQCLLYAIKDSIVPKLLKVDNLPQNTKLIAVGCSSNNVSDDIEHSFTLPRADYNILSLGRLDKPYISHMVENVVDFVQSNSKFTYNFIVIGDAHDSHYRDSILFLTSKIKNLRTHMLGEMYPIPRQILDKADVAIACAGCVYVCSSNGIPTISIDANDFEAIGIYGVTTNNTIFRNGESFQLTKNLLKSILLENTCKRTYPPIQTVKVDYSAHVGIFKYCDVNSYYSVEYHKTIKQKILSLFIDLFGYQSIMRILLLLKK